MEVKNVNERKRTLTKKSIKTPKKQIEDDGKDIDIYIPNDKELFCISTTNTETNTLYGTLEIQNSSSNDIKDIIKTLNKPIQSTEEKIDQLANSLNENTNIESIQMSGKNNFIDKDKIILNSSLQNNKDNDPYEIYDKNGKIDKLLEIIPPNKEIILENSEKPIIPYEERKFYLKNDYFDEFERVYFK